MKERPQRRVLQEDYDGHHGLAVFLSSDNRFGHMHFTPCATTNFDSRVMSRNLLMAIEGLQDFFNNFIDQDGHPEPKFLRGVSNSNMAHATRRLGFEVEKTFEGDYKVFGETKVVRQKLEELVSETDTQGRTVVDRLRTRVS